MVFFELLVKKRCITILKDNIMFEIFKKKKSSIGIEILSRELGKTAVIDCIKKEFLENKDLKEAVLITTGADEGLIMRANKLLDLDIRISDEFKLSYLAFITTNDHILKLIVIASKGLEGELENIMQQQKFIFRIKNE